MTVFQIKKLFKIGTVQEKVQSKAKSRTKKEIEQKFALSLKNAFVMRFLD